MKLSTILKSTGRISLMAVLFSLLLAFAVACGDDNNGGGNNGGNNGTDAGGMGDDGGGMGDDGGGMGDDGGGMGDDGGGTGSCTPVDTTSDCSLLCQDCGTDQACVRGQDSQGNTVQACQPAGTGMQGDTCDGQNPCAAGYGCFVQNQGDTSGTCQQYCRMDSTDAPQCAEGSCLGVQGLTGIGVCVVANDECTVYPNDTCSDGEHCQPSPSGNSCVANGDTAVGETCNAGGDCGDQAACSNIGDGPQCYQLCDPQADPTDCPDGTQCGGIVYEQGADPAFFACVAQ